MLCCYDRAIQGHSGREFAVLTPCPANYVKCSVTENLFGIVLYGTAVVLFVPMGHFLG